MPALRLPRPLRAFRSRRSTPDDAAVRARLASIAARGWIPGPHLAVKGALELVENGGRADERAGSGSMAATAARLWRELPDDAAPDSAAPAGTAYPAGDDAGEFAGWSRLGGRHSGSTGAGVVRRLRTVLAGVRLDPGHRPAAAVVVVAVVAVVVTIAFVLRARPTPQTVGAAPPVVPAPAPVTSGTAAVPVGPAAPGAGAVSGGTGAARGGTARSSAAGGMIVVAVTGKVRHPGLVHLPVGSRVADAIDAAGGLRPGADVGLLNLARVLSDGEQVLVGIGGSAGAPPAPGSSEPAGGPINLNTATAAQLDTLPGVGEVTAQKIIDYRTAHGPFRSIAALQDVPGIGPARYAEIAPGVTL